MFEWNALQKWVSVLCCTFSVDFSQVNVNNGQIKDFFQIDWQVFSTPELYVQVSIISHQETSKGA